MLGYMFQYQIQCFIIYQAIIIITMNGYQISCVKVISTKDMILSVMKQLQNTQDLSAYTNQIGNDIYMFEATYIYKSSSQQTQSTKKMQKPHYSAFTRPSTKQQIFFAWYFQKSGKKLTPQKLESPSFHFFPLSNHSQATSNKILLNFVQNHNPDIVCVQTFFMERKIFARRWFQKLPCCWDEWDDCEIVLTKAGIIEKVKGQITGLIIFVASFEVRFGKKQTGTQFGIDINTCHREIKFKAANAKDFFLFLFKLNQILEKIKSSNNRQFSSNFYKRKFNKVQYLVDAQEYFISAAKAIEQAKKQIFICGWWISPQLPLIRPLTPANKKYRLDNLLKMKAAQGVQIYLIAFNAPSIIPNNPTHTSQTFRSLHQNIHILTHPPNLIPTIFSHHEKLIMVDQSIAFLGGVDLCYGRYDSSSHPIDNNSIDLYPGIEYNNNRIKDFINVMYYDVDALPREKPRLPWHDIGMKVQGAAVGDLGYHFVEYWNNCYLQEYVIMETKMDQRGKGDKKQNERERDRSQMMMEEKKEEKVKPVDQNERLGLAIILQVLKDDKKIKLPSIPIKSIDELSDYFNIRKKIQQKNKFLILSHESFGLSRLSPIQWQNKKKGFTDCCQVLRSASEWSIGLKTGDLQNSILQAYLYLIENAKTHIYIQNQFFISSSGSASSFVKNQIANALLSRIKRAIKQSKPFKVLIMMPLLPGQQGNMLENPPQSLSLIIHWQYSTISRGQHSLLSRLTSLTPIPQNYLIFLSLRQHGLLQSTPVTEQIYIHSKLMIIDDDTLICGSANINDRSMLGNRDSELAMVVQGMDKVIRKIGNEETKVSGKIHALRVKLWGEHFGKGDWEDPITGWDLIRNRAQENTRIYRELFGCYPDDQIKKLADGIKMARQPTTEEYKEKSKKIIGNVVEFPLYYKH